MANDDETVEDDGWVGSRALEFPPLPVVGTELLVPLRSWEAVHREMQVTGCEFDMFWFDSVLAGVACFFAWMGEPRCTVLVVWDDMGITHTECRGDRDQRVSRDREEEIGAMVREACANLAWGRLAGAN